MDLLSQRYASPFLILDEFIRLQQLHDFVVEIIITITKEKKHNARWEYYLHKVHDMSFDDYVEYCERSIQNEENKHMSNEKISDVINESKRMLEGFHPE